MHRLTLLLLSVPDSKSFPSSRVCPSLRSPNHQLSSRSWPHHHFLLLPPPPWRFATNDKGRRGELEGSVRQKRYKTRPRGFQLLIDWNKRPLGSRQRPHVTIAPQSSCDETHKFRLLKRSRQAECWRNGTRLATATPSTPNSHSYA